jgi:uncharacterized cupin superfamily protein
MAHAGKGWSVVRLRDVPPVHEPSSWAPFARTPDFGRRWHAIGDHLHIGGFGVAANEASSGGELIVPHDEVEFGGQEELYVVLRGRARFVCDGEAVELAEHDLLHVAALVRREAVALETPTLLLMVGGTPGKAYDRGW